MEGSLFPEQLCHRFVHIVKLLFIEFKLLYIEFHKVMFMACLTVCEWYRRFPLKICKREALGRVSLILKVLVPPDSPDGEGDQENQGSSPPPLSDSQRCCFLLLLSSAPAGVFS